MMPDREKVIKGLESCEPSVFKRDCSCCPYKDEMNCDYVLWNDALALLKEQQENIQYWSDKYDEMGRLYMKIRDEQPQIVMCKDCKHGKPYNDKVQCLHPRNNIWFCQDADWFCADGERRTDP